MVQEAAGFRENVGKLQDRFKGFAWGKVRINLYSSA